MPRITEKSVLRIGIGSLISPSVWRIAVQDPVVAQDDHPGVGPDEVARPERQHHEDQQQHLVPAAVARDPVRDRVADQDRQDGREQRVAERVERTPAGTPGRVAWK